MKYLLTAALLLAACGARAAPPATPAASLDDDVPTMLTCWNGGDVLYRETTHTLEHGARPDVLTIYASGAWHAEGDRERSGCLAADDLAGLETRLQSLHRAAPDAPTCEALPTHHTLIEVPDVGALSDAWPCGSGPDASTAAAIEAVHELTRRRG
jgi:hypothetical protein